MTVFTDGPDEKLNGIPFYVQKGIIKQETKYLYKWLEVSFIKTEKKSGKSEQSLVKSKKVQIPKNMQELQTQLNAIDDLVDNLNGKNIIQSNALVKNIEKKIEALTNAKLPLDMNLLDTIRNHWEHSVMVDYSKKYYLNSKMHWFGSSTQTQKLASNGTLSEASVSSDSQLDELAGTIAGLATPLASVKVAKIENQKQEEGVPLLALPPAQISYKLKIEEKGFVYSFTKIIDPSKGKADKQKDNKIQKYPAIPFDLNEGNFTRTSWPETPKKPKENKPTINVSGSIQLPKGKK